MRTLRRSAQSPFLVMEIGGIFDTPGNLTELLFRDDDDYRYVMNLMARCLAEVPGLAVVAFEVMSNHLHIVICGSEVGTRLFFRAVPQTVKQVHGHKV